MKAHVYDVCRKVCKLYNIGDDDATCVHCGESRCEESGKPVETMKMISVGDLISSHLQNPKTREMLRYRAKREEDHDLNQRKCENEGHQEDFFDGEIYRQLKFRGMFQNDDDVAVVLYTDGFVVDDRGSRVFTMIHMVILNFDPLVRYTQRHHVQLAILPGPDKPKDQNSFLLPIIAELNFLANHGMTVKKYGEEICKANFYLVMATGDIPAIHDMSGIAHHASRYGCRCCVEPGVHPDNWNYGMYFVGRDARLRFVD